MALPTVNFLDPDFRHSPQARFTELRAAGGLARVENFGAYLVTDYARCAAFLKDPKVGLEQTDLTRFAPTHPLASYFEMRKGLMLFQNAPSHQALRGPVEEPFSAKLIKGWEPLIRERARSYLNRFRAAETIHFVKEISQPFVSEVICRVVGFTRDEDPLLCTLTQKIADGLDPLGPYHSKVAAGQSYRAFLHYMKTRASEPASGHASGPSEAPLAEEHPLALLPLAARCPHALGFRSSEDLTATTVMLLAAGHQTTNHSLALSIHSLLTTQPELLRQKSSISPLLIEELFRYHCPAQLTRRTVLEDTELLGKAYPAGSALWLALASANRDETIFPNGQALQFDRRPNPHLSFGAGQHFCLGATLARLQLRVFLEELSGFFPRLRLAERGLQPDPNLIFRGLKELVLET